MALHSPNILALGAGGCGIELGIKLVLPEARIVGYVEREAFAAANLAAKIEEGILDEAPIWADVADFDGAAYRGLVDIVSIGLPCQPFSVAGKQEGIKDHRWLWPQVWDILRAVRPQYLFMEEVRGFVQSGFPVVLGDLARDGWSAEWGLFSARALGAPHRRQRFFLLAYAPQQPEREQNNQARAEPRQHTWPTPSRGSCNVDDAMPGRHGGPQGQICPRRNSPFPPGPTDWGTWRQVHPSLEPAICGMADGMAHRVERLRLCGNGVVPVVAAVALVVLGRRLEEG